MAAGAQTTKIVGYCAVDFNHFGHEYRNINSNIIQDLCTDVILGMDFQEQHESVDIKYTGNKPTLTLCAPTTIHVEPRRFSKPD